MNADITKGRREHAENDKAAKAAKDKCPLANFEPCREDCAWLFSKNSCSMSAIANQIWHSK